jgi:undecaprenyl-diphosphatase
MAFAAALLAVLAAAAARRSGADTSLFLLVNGWRGVPDAVWETLSVAGLGLSALAALSVGARRHPRVFAALPWMLIVGGGLTHLVKHVAPLPRPAAVLAAADLHVVGQRLLQRTLPSGHAMTAVAVVVVLFLAGGPFWRRPTVVAGSVLLAAAIGVSRVASGAHWPVDVAAGAVLGWATGCVSVHLAALTRTEAGLATAGGQWLVTATQLGAGAAIAMDQGYGRTLPLQWVLATLAVWAGVRTITERPGARVRAQRPARVGGLGADPPAQVRS